jgi:hypothetical protein
MRDCLSLCCNDFSSIIIAFVRVSTLEEPEQLYTYMNKLGSEEQFLCFTFSATDRREKQATEAAISLFIPLLSSMTIVGGMQLRARNFYLRRPYEEFTCDERVVPCD